MDNAIVYQGLFAKVLQLGGYKSPVYELRLDHAYATYARAIDWKKCSYTYSGRVQCEGGQPNRAYGTPTALIQVVKALEAKEKAFGKNKGDQLWLNSFHPMDQWLCGKCGEVKS